jgi:hypothetical protein
MVGNLEPGVVGCNSYLHLMGTSASKTEMENQIFIEIRHMIRYHVFLGVDSLNYKKLGENFTPATPFSR